MTSRFVPAALACFTLCASLAVAQPQRRDPKEFWNQNHKEQRQLARTEPNEFMVRMLKDRKPGRALDIGMGQGRNALWLAKQGVDAANPCASGRRVALYAPRRRLALRATYCCAAARAAQGLLKWSAQDDLRQRCDGALSRRLISCEMWPRSDEKCSSLKQRMRERAPLFSSRSRAR